MPFFYELTLQLDSLRIEASFKANPIYSHTTDTISKDDPFRRDTIAGLWKRQLKEHPDDIAVIDPHRQLTFRQLDELSCTIASMSQLQQHARRPHRHRRGSQRKDDCSHTLSIKSRNGLCPGRTVVPHRANTLHNT